MKKLAYAAIGLVFLASCSGGGAKKVVILGRGEIDAKENSITMKGSTGYAEKTIELGEKAELLKVETPDDKKDVSIPEGKGTFVLNLKTDTIVGSRQFFGKDLSSSKVITLEELGLKIDSLVQLTTGANVKAGGSNFIILPNQVIKISDNPEAKFYGPFTKIPQTMEMGKDGKEPELYKFYTNTEMRELIEKLKKMTIPVE